MGTFQSGINQLLGKAAGMSSAYQVATGTGSIGKFYKDQKAKKAEQKKQWQEKAQDKLSIKKETTELRKSIILGADAMPLTVKENKDDNSK